MLLGAGLTSRSVHRKVSSVRGWFKYLRKQGLMVGDPMSKIILPKMPKMLVKDAQQAIHIQIKTANKIPFSEIDRSR